MVTHLAKNDEFSNAAESLNFIICLKDLQISDFCCKSLFFPSRETLKHLLEASREVNIHVMLLLFPPETPKDTYKQDMFQS